MTLICNIHGPQTITWLNENIRYSENNPSTIPSEIKVCTTCFRKGKWKWIWEDNSCPNRTNFIPPCSYKKEANDSQEWGSYCMLNACWSVSFKLIAYTLTGDGASTVIAKPPVWPKTFYICMSHYIEIFTDNIFMPNPLTYHFQPQVCVQCKTNINRRWELKSKLICEECMCGSSPFRVKHKFWTMQCNVRYTPSKLCTEKVIAVSGNLELCAKHLHGMNLMGSKYFHSCASLSSAFDY